MAGRPPNWMGMQSSRHTLHRHSALAKVSLSSNKAFFKEISLSAPQVDTAGILYLFHYSHLPWAFLLLPSPTFRQLRYFCITECWTSLFQALRAIPVLKWGLWEDVKSHILKMCSQVNKFLLSQDSLTFWDPDQILVPGTLLWLLPVQASQFFSFLSV